MYLCNPIRRRRSLREHEVELKGAFTNASEAKKEALEIAKDKFDWLDQAEDLGIKDDPDISAYEEPVVRTWTTRKGEFRLSSLDAEGDVKKVFVVRQRLKDRTSFKAPSKKPYAFYED